MDEGIQKLDKEPEIELRPVARENAEAYFRLVASNREHFAKFGNMSPDKYQNTQDVQDALSNAPERQRWAIYSSGTLVGVIVLKPDNNSPETGEIGYLVAEQYGNRGIATAATTELMRRSLGYKSFIATTHPDNVPSQRVLQKAGFIPAGKNDEGRLVFRYERPARV